jgi:thiamine biosynthesis lipoprotein
MVATATWRALGTRVDLLLTSHDAGAMTAARAAVEETLERVDLVCSRFRADSELSRLNARSGETVTVGPLLAQFIEAGLRGARLSDGLVDPTVGRAMRAVGYDDDFATVRDRAGPITIRIEPIPGYQAIDFNRLTRTVRLAKGVEIDLGSTAKALAADLAAAAASDATAGGGVLVSLGGDIAIAGEVPLEGWRVLAAEDSETPATADGEVVALHGGALATSSTTVRRWTRDGILLHHLIDPDTGQPTTGPWRTASVIAGNCLDANIAATAAIVRGDGAAPWLTQTGLAARLVAHDGTVLCVAGWPEPLVA